MADFRTARGAYSTELSDPAVRDRLLAMTHAEVGGQGPQAQQAFLESIFNRASSRGQTLGQTLSGSYFPEATHSRAARGVNDAQRGLYAPLLDEVLGGSNVSNYATGNASGTVGFAGGPQTAAFNGERYGVEGPDRKWARSMGFADDAPMAQAIAAEGTKNMTPIEAALAQARTKLQGFTPQPGEDPGILSSLAQQYAPAAAPYVPSADTFDKLALAGSMLRDNPGATAAGVAAYKAKQQDSDVQTIAHGDNLIQINRRTGKVLGMTKLPTEGKLVTSTNEDILGNKTQRHDIFKDGVLTPAQTAGAPNAPDTTAGPDMSPVLAPGVKFDDSLTGDDRLKQYKPEYQAAIKAYVNGESMPTSSRVGKAATWIKQQAQRYGQDTGTLVDDNTFNAKRKVLTELGAGSFGSLGGQLTAAKTYLGHLGEGVDAFNKLGNYDNSDNLIGMIPGSGMATHALNKLGNSKANTAPFVKAVDEVADKAGAEGVKLYAGSRGGVDERKEAKTIFDASQQPAEMKERVSAAVKLANDKIEQLLGQTESALGKNHPRVTALRAELEEVRTKLNDKLTFGQYMKK